MILELLPSNSKLLHTPTIPFDFENPPIDPKELFENLRDTMFKHYRKGLSANQVGIPYSVFVMGDHKDPENAIPVFNPKIVSTMGDMIYLEEGCLSYPNLWVKIKRPSQIRVRYSTYTGNTDTIKFEGLTARVFQHEYDHIMGIPYTSRTSKFHLEAARKKIVKENKQEKIRKDRERLADVERKIKSNWHLEL